MATKQLLVELDSKFDDMIKDQKKVNAQLEKMHEKSKKADNALGKLSKTAKGVGGALGSMGSMAKAGAVSMAAMGAAMLAAGAAAADMGKNIQNSADVAKLSVEEMQAMAFATNTVGINMERLADISKDTSERVGDFLNTGEGGFMDFVDAMKFTDAQAKEVAKSFKGMAGVDILQSMVTQMEEAGVSAEQMSHALEGMASETTRLIPLMKDGGRAASELRQEFIDTAVVLTKSDLNDLSDMSKEFSKLGENFKGVIGKFSVEYADEINNMIETTNKGLKIMGDEFASGALTKRLNAFYDAFSSSWSTAMGEKSTIAGELSDNLSSIFQTIGDNFLKIIVTMPLQMKKVGTLVRQAFAESVGWIMEKAAEANLLIEKLSAGFSDSSPGVQNAERLLTLSKEINADKKLAHSEEIAGIQKEIDLIYKKYQVENELATAQREQFAADSQARIDAANEEHQAKTGNFTGVGLEGEGEGEGGATGAPATPEEDPRYINELALLDLLSELRLTGMESFQEVLDMELAMHQTALEQKLISEEQFNQKVFESKKKAKLAEMKYEQEDTKRKIANTQAYTKIAAIANEQLFNDNKAIKAGIIIADTAAAVMNQMSSGDPYTAFARAALAGAMGAVQLANLNSASKGGGSISTGSDGSVSAAPRPADFAPETTGVEVSERDASGAQQTVVVKIETDSDDPLINTIAEQLDRNQRQGG